MTTSTDDVVFIPGFDHGTDPALLRDHYDEWTRLQAEHRVIRSDLAAGFGYTLWYLLRYDDIASAFQDPALFSSRCVNYLGQNKQRMLPIELDPPDHMKYRQLLSRPLSPANVAPSEAAVRATCAQLFDHYAPAGECEFVGDIALRLPTGVFLRLMGLPTDRTDEFVALARTLLQGTEASDPDGALRSAAATKIVGHVLDGIEAKRREPADDLLTTLVGAEIDGAPITTEALVAMGFLLYLAGLDTVANVLAYSMAHLAADPELRAVLAADPAGWTEAVEELLRYYSIASTARVVTRDAEFAGCPMKAGDRVVLVTALAGRDPRQFADAATFVPGRFPNRHLGFGAGPHRCVGAHLARLELRVALEEWHRRIPDYAVAPGATLRQHVGPVAGLDALPLVWTPPR